MAKGNVSLEHQLAVEVTRRDPGDRRGRQLDIAEAERAVAKTLEALCQLPAATVAELMLRARDRLQRRARRR